RYHLVLLALLGLLGACSNGEEPSNNGAVQVHLFTVGEDQAANERNFAGRVDAVSTVDMAFEVPGRLLELPARQGELVPQGGLLAALDPADYELALSEAQIADRQAKRDLERGKQLRAGNHLSQSDLEQLQIAADNATLGLTSAQRNLNHSRLQAPFDALVSRRLVERFTTVQAMEPVLRVQDVSELRIHISVPELFMRRFTGQPGDYRVSLVLDSALIAEPANGVPLELAYREHSTEADPVTQTYQVTFGLPRPEHIQLLPGMTLAVRVTQLSASDSQRWWIPVAALDTSNADQFSVWRYDPDSGDVSRQSVSVGSLRNNQAEITEGLQAGDQVVAAGIRQLSEGQAVEPFAGY
ncbi:MAG: efflux RND transporter periplasmic adaptor subunit, partial [Pseudomonadaceae bacterium]